MNDLHERLRAAIEERRALATEAADGAGGPAWVGKQARCECCDRILPDPDVTPGAHSTIAAFDDRISPHIVANDPATVLRHCAEDLYVLDLHKPFVARYRPDRAGCSQCSLGELTPEIELWPCPEIQSLARRYGLTDAPSPESPRGTN